MTPDSGLELAIPASLAARIRSAAEEEHRPMIDILRDAMDRYLAARDHREVSRTEDLSAADIEAILAGTMDTQYDYLNGELPLQRIAGRFV